MLRTDDQIKGEYIFLKMRFAFARVTSLKGKTGGRLQLYHLFRHFIPPVLYAKSTDQKIKSKRNFRCTFI